MLVSFSASELWAKAPSNTYVMIVANNHSLDKNVKSLRYADDDAIAYYDLFSLVGSHVELFTVFDDETAKLHPKLSGKVQIPTKAAIFGTLDRWNKAIAKDKAAGKESELIFIYAGHGDIDENGEGYVNLQASKLRRRDLYQRILAPSKANYVHLIIDACKSYFFVNRRGGDSTWKNDEAPRSRQAELKAFLKSETLDAYPNAGVILATSGDQSTHEWSRYRGGILSHELRSALAGAADINSDGKIEYSEIHAFIAAANLKLLNPEARLNIYAKAPAVNRRRALFYVNAHHNGLAHARLLRFDRALSGRFYLQDDRGLRVADLNKARGLNFNMVIDPKRGYFLRKGDQEAEIAPGKKQVRVASLDYRLAKTSARGSLDETFRKKLYEVSFSRGFYDGFCAQTGHLPVEKSDSDAYLEAESNFSAGGSNDLSVGFIANNELSDLSGLNYGVALRYHHPLYSWLSLSVSVEYGRSQHDGAASDFSMHRLAALIGASVNTPTKFFHTTFRADFAMGYQSYIGSGEIDLAEETISGSDYLGLRIEAGVGAGIDLVGPLFADLRGGVSIDFVTIADREEVNPSGFFSIGLGYRF